ncbi:hypothetical protein RBSH_04362 [Rhodopirellula baltica SH28]|uniref:Uncharacterized protein n=1 Tax=Rhodopirellula baltica SH28 TaxID=993517 RepID=K5E3J3_RHOBT|nr:hypothetical protein RBSH_04362 [Rhodopirellula baltica SH28]
MGLPKNTNRHSPEFHPSSVSRSFLPNPESDRVFCNQKMTD